MIIDHISIDLRQHEKSSRFEIIEGRYYLDGREIRAEEAISSLLLSLRFAEDRSIPTQVSANEDDGFADIRLIEWLLYKSGVSNYQISKKSKIGESTLSRITSGETSLHSVRFQTAIKLTEYAKQIQSERIILEKGRDVL